MSWNRPTEPLEINPPHNKGLGRFKWVLIISIFAIIALTVYYVTKSPQPSVDTENEAVVKTTLPVTNVIQSVSNPVFPPPVVEKTKKVATPPTLTHDDLLPRLNKLNPNLFRDHEVFTRESDQLIADILLAQPGERLMEFELGEMFERKFTESLKFPISDHELDTPDDRALKAAVRDARQKLAELQSQGESVAQIMKETRDDLNKIANYRDILETEFHRVLNSENEEYVDSYVTEANALLDRYGAPHIEFTDKRRAKLRMRIQSEN